MDKITQTDKVTSPYFSNNEPTLAAASIVSSSLTDTNETYFFGISHTDKTLTSNAQCTEKAINLVMAERNEVDEIKINVSKGYELGLNNVIYLDVDDEDVRGEHRISSKNISFNGNTLSYTLGLDKLGPVTSDYILKGE